MAATVVALIVIGVMTVLMVTSCDNPGDSGCSDSLGVPGSGVMVMEGRSGGSGGGSRTSGRRSYTKPKPRKKSGSSKNHSKHHHDYDCD